MTHRPRRRARTGFTLIEILAVFIVFGVSAMIAVRSVGDTLRRDRVSKATVILSADLEQAFAIAARQRTPVRVFINDTTLTVSIRDRADTTHRYRHRSFKAGEFSLDIMPTGLATDTLRLTLGILSQGGATYSQTLRMTRAGLVRIGNR
jgi:prepilin-type N-terminal cleavage/methylation domain-containing protein